LYRPRTVLGFIGSGDIGQAIARKAIAHGHDVVMSNSPGPETLTDVIAELGPQARAPTSAQAAAAADIAVVTIPFKNVPQVPVAELAGKVVIDTDNYYFEHDGHFPDIDSGDADAKRQVADLIESFGFYVVDAGPVPEGRRFDRDKPAYGPNLDAIGPRRALAQA
jgi:predicted dinucleotide-binding enzyme